MTGRWLVELLTQMETVDAQAGICGVVQPSFLSPAAGRVCVHLSRCNPWKKKHNNKTDLALKL